MTESRQPGKTIIDLMARIMNHATRATESPGGAVKDFLAMAVLSSMLTPKLKHEVTRG